MEMKNKLDIATKLRSYKRDRSGYAEYCHQGANEIDRLRQQLVERDKQQKMYELALMASWPNGAKGEAFEFWNSARKIANALEKHEI